MSDERELTSEQEERVRRLLAEARVDAPMPEDVATRLDAVLAQLAEGQPPGANAQVVALASRRRRKVTTLLVAAAAVVVVGIGAGQLLEGTGSDGESASSLDSGDAQGAPDAVEEEAPARRGASDLRVDPGSVSSLVSGAPVVRESHFADDVARIARRGRVANQSSPDAPFHGDTDETTDHLICDPADWGPGRLQLVRYQGRPAVLAFRAPVGASQVVDLLQCGTGETLRSVTLPVG
ncbi:hypothetical protein [Nocardioides sp. cx-173]|uniref:hypothetical protein n=1 Tax=Nocardioides sp. cx-173 TaxID=2898796 RepID=UPI001E3031A3|nr:hypothetical protein [Nocardioides sp. cx-173]MCD4523745.1 hypothetical protein [Nocardioides sp. cx-173]UGB41929.1 hypothetical protein LQ940_21615 [Nocardioides sp. cx-173]